MVKDKLPPPATAQRRHFDGLTTKQIQKWIHQSYLDKLNGNITESEWKKHNELWNAEKIELSMKLANHHKEDASFLEKADLILELAKSASSLFKNAGVSKKHKILNLLVSNCICKDGKVDVELRSPFKVIMKTSKTGKWCPTLDALRTFNWRGLSQQMPAFVLGV